MAQYDLVPGAWLGGWAWRKVRARLEAAGHDVVTPTLTGWPTSCERLPRPPQRATGSWPR